jgi:hypothetical protein
MKRFLYLLLAGGGLAATAYGQRFEIGAFGGWPRFPQKPLGSTSTESKQDNDTLLSMSQAVVGGRFTLNSTGYYGHELSYWRTSGRLSTTRRVTQSRQLITTTYQDSIRIQNVSYNFLIYFMPGGEKWRPFITGGVHAQQYDEPNFDFWVRGRSRNYGANYGAGLKLLPVKHVLFRLDWRHFLGGKPWDLEYADFRVTGGMIGTMTASAGLSITF